MAMQGLLFQNKGEKVLFLFLFSFLFGLSFKLSLYFSSYCLMCSSRDTHVARAAPHRGPGLPHDPVLRACMPVLPMPLPGPTGLPGEHRGARTPTGEMQRW